MYYSYVTFKTLTVSPHGIIKLVKRVEQRDGPYLYGYKELLKRSTGLRDLRCDSFRKNTHPIEEGGKNRVGSNSVARLKIVRSECTLLCIVEKSLPFVSKICSGNQMFRSSF